MPTSLPPLLHLSEEDREKLSAEVVPARMKSVREIWPQFPEYVSQRFSGLAQSEPLKRSVERFQSRLRRQRYRSDIGLWDPLDEAFETVLQETGASVRAALALEGKLNPDSELEVGFRLLGDTVTSVRCGYSRVIRPSRYVSPSSLPLEPSVGHAIEISDGEWAGWAVLAHYETELVVTPDWNHKIDGKHSVYSGIHFSDEFPANGDLPLGIPRGDLWNYSRSPSISFGGFRGPLASLVVGRDNFGILQILGAHPIVAAAGRLRSAPFFQGLTLLDEQGEPALVGRIWKERLLGPDESQHQHRLEGMDVLIRQDILNKVQAFSDGPARYVMMRSD